MWVRSTSVPARYLMTFTIISAVASAITLRLTWHFPALFRCRVTRYFESSITATLTDSRADRLVKMPPLASQLPAYRQLRYWQKSTIARAGKSVRAPPLTPLPQARWWMGGWFRRRAVGRLAAVLENRVGDPGRSGDSWGGWNRSE